MRERRDQPARNLAEDHGSRDAEDFAGIRLFHQNLVMGKLVERAAEDRYCSAFRGFQLMRGAQRLKSRSWQGIVVGTARKACPDRNLAGKLNGP